MGRAPRDMRQRRADSWRPPSSGWARRPSVRLTGRKIRAAVAALALAQELRQLGRQHVAGRQLPFGRQLVGPLLEFGHIARGVVVGGDGLADLLGVRLCGLG